jgi:hypothetical protein
MMRHVVIVALAFGVLGSFAPADDGSGVAAPAEVQKLVGFWSVDLATMSTDPRYAKAWESDEGRAALAYAEGVLFEFSPDHHVRIHMGHVQDHPATITAQADGTLRLDPDGASPWIVGSITADSFVQSFPDVGFELLWTRSLDPFVGTWSIAMEDLDGEQWFTRLNDEQRLALQPEIEAVRLVVDEQGGVSGHWGGEDRGATLKLESTAPPAAALIGPNEVRPSAHLVRREDSHASLYVGDRTWPLERVHPPSRTVIGDWKFDVDRAVTMDWLKRSVPEGKTIEEFLRENVKLDTVIPVTATTWNNQRYAVVDERANQFSAEAHGVVVFWVRVIDEDHLSQFAGGGREFPLMRAKAGDE